MACRHCEHRYEHNGRINNVEVAELKTAMPDRTRDRAVGALGLQFLAAAHDRSGDEGADSHTRPPSSKPSTNTNHSRLARSSERHAHQLKHVIPTLGADKRISTKFWVPSSDTSTAQLPASFDHEKAQFRSDQVIAMLKLTEALAIAQRKELPNKILVRGCLSVLVCVMTEPNPSLL